MRHINVKKGSSRYKLKGDDGVYIGELTIMYAPEDRTCGIDLSKLGASMSRLSIEGAKL